MATAASTSNQQRSSAAAAPAASAVCIPDSDDSDLLNRIDWSVMDCNSEEAVSLALLNVVELDHEEIAYMEDSPSSSSDQKVLSNDRAEDIRNEINNFKRSREEEEEEGKVKNAADSTDPHDLQGRALSGTDSREAGTLVVTVDGHPHVSRRQKKKRRCLLPKRPLNAFAFFYHDERQKIVESMESSLSEDDIQRQVGKLWRHLSQDEQQKYESLAEQDKERFQKEMLVHASCKPHLKNDLDDEEDDDAEDEEKEEFYASTLPPPPPGVMVIQAHGGPSTPTPSDGESGVEAAPGIVTPSGSWGYPTPVLSERSEKTPSLPRPDFRQPRVVTDPGRATPSGWNGPPPVLPFPPHHLRHHSHPPPASRPYSPHFGRPARPVCLPMQQPRPYQSQSFCIPPDMQLALQSGAAGEERKYKVTYQCFKMRPEAVQPFLDSLGGRRPPQAPYPHPHHNFRYPGPYHYGPPRW